MQIHKSHNVHNQSFVCAFLLGSNLAPTYRTFMTMAASYIKRTLLVHHKAVYSAALMMLLILVVTSTVWAQTTGKIAGKITDKDGLPMPGTNIVLEGSTRGASSDTKGDYFILNISPGTYTLIFSIIGYETVRVTDVRVQVDRTTTIDMVMREANLTLDEIVVSAEASMITRDQTSASAKITGDELKVLPTDSFLKTISLQAGVNRSAGGSIHIRGGRSTEIKYYVDGVAVSNPFSNGLAVPVQNESIQEIEVISGTFNAEYGQANSGIINIVTKDGSDTFAATFNGSVGGFFTGRNDIFYDIEHAKPYGQQVYESTLSGPIFKEKLTFFTNFRYTDSEGYLFGRRIFTPSDSSVFSSNDPTSWIIRSSGDSAFVPMNVSTSNSALAKLTWKISNSIKVSYSATRSYGKSQGYSHLYRYNPDYRPTSRSESYNHLLTLNHILNNRTFYNLRLTSYSTNAKQFVYEDPFDERYRFIEGRNQQPSDVFNTGGVNNYHFRRTSTTWAARFDISRQMNTYHLVKTGVEFRYNDLFQRDFFIQARRQTGLTREIPPIESRFHNTFTKNPYEFAAFLQDKIEVRDLIINVGVRFDYFNANSEVPTDLRDPGNTRGALYDEAYTPASAKYQLSPRIGFAFPISSSGVIHASYGQFFQIPEFSRLYENPEFEVTASNFSQYIGNADLEAQRSTTYEIGLQQELGMYTAIDLTAYYRDIRNLLGTGLYASRTGGDSWGRYENADFGSVRGISLAWNIRTDVGVRGSINYTYQSARGNGSDPKQAFFDAQANNEATRILIPLAWDQRHNVGGSLTYQKGLFNAGLIGSYGTGYPFTPTDLQRQPLSELRNEARYEPEFEVDLRLARNFKLSGFTGQVYLFGENILDFYRQDRRPRLYIRDIEAHNQSGKNVINSLEEYRSNPAVHPSPRLVRLGFQILI
jgi:outer membrane receptor protein involved in Fe transport